MEKTNKYMMLSIVMICLIIICLLPSSSVNASSYSDYYATYEIREDGEGISPAMSFDNLLDENFISIVHDQVTLKDSYNGSTIIDPSTYGFEIKYFDEESDDENCEEHIIDFNDLNEETVNELRAASSINNSFQIYLTLEPTDDHTGKIYLCTVSLYENNDIRTLLLSGEITEQNSYDADYEWIKRPIMGIQRKVNLNFTLTDPQSGKTFSPDDCDIIYKKKGTDIVVSEEDLVHSDYTVTIKLKDTSYTGEIRRYLSMTCENYELSSEWVDVISAQIDVDGSGTLREVCSVCGNVISSTSETITRVTSIKLAKETAVYTGFVIKPSVCVHAGDVGYDEEFKVNKGFNLTEGKDYIVTTPGDIIEPGVYKIKVDGINHYSFSKELTFTVTEKDKSIADTNSLDTPNANITNAAKGIKISWKQIKGATGYQVYRKISGAKTWTKIYTIKKASVVTYTDSKVSNGKKYYYAVKAYNSSSKSNMKSSSLLKYIKSPDIKLSKGSKGIKLSWKKIKGATTYKVYRKKKGDKSWKLLKKNVKKKTYVDKTARKGKTYYYAVRAVNGKYASGLGKKKIKR